MPKKKTTEETTIPAPAPEPTPVDLAQINPAMLLGKRHPMMSVIVDVTDESGAVIRTESYIVSAQLKMTVPDRPADQPPVEADVKNFVGSMFAVGSGGPSLDVEARMVRVLRPGDASKTSAEVKAARDLERAAPPPSKKGSFEPKFAKVPKPVYEPSPKESK